MTGPILVRRERPVGPMHPGLPRASSVVGATAGAWVGLVVHPGADLPGQANAANRVQDDVSRPDG